MGRWRPQMYTVSSWVAAGDVLSRVMNVMLSFEGFEDRHIPTMLNDYLRLENGAGELRDLQGTYDSAWGGPKGPTCNLWAGTLNHGDPDDLVRKFGELPWREPAVAQLFIQDQEDRYFRLWMIRGGEVREYTPVDPIFAPEPPVAASASPGLGAFVAPEFPLPPGVGEIPDAVVCGFQSVHSLEGGHGATHYVATSASVDELARIFTAVHGPPVEQSDVRVNWRFKDARSSSYVDVWAVGHGEGPGFEAERVPSHAQAVVAMGTFFHRETPPSPPSRRSWWRNH